jgi:hypothetical protein
MLPRLDWEGSPSPTKKLLSHVDGVYLFEIREGKHVSYSIERGDRVWECPRLRPAVTKFLLVVKGRGSHRGYSK